MTDLQIIIAGALLALVFLLKFIRHARRTAPDRRRAKMVASLENGGSKSRRVSAGVSRLAVNR